MKAIKLFLSKWGLHSFLLPVFFVLHNYMQYYGLVSEATAIKVLFEIWTVVLVGFLILFLLIKKATKSLLIVTLLSAVFLFYGAIKDFFSDLPVHFMARYIVLLPLTVFVLLLIIVRIIKNNEFGKTNLFLNILLLFFLGAEGILMFWYGTTAFMQHNRIVKNNIVNVDSLSQVKDRPDVYYMVFDSYPGSGFLQEFLQFKNSGLDSALAARGFFIAKNPRSNYNRTALSIASTLNFEYLQNIPDQSEIKPIHYNQSSLSIEHAAVPEIFTHFGYNIFNLSSFDLAQHKSIYKENFLVLPEERMLLYNTLKERMRFDIFWHIEVLKRKDLELRQQDFLKESIKKRDYNNHLIDSLPKIALGYTHAPKFIYAHFYLPHPPFFYDRSGTSLPIDINYAEKAMEQKEVFLSYLEYTNSVIIKTIDSIFKKSAKTPVIIIQSDHGYRDFRKDFVNPNQYFKNYSAFYFPDKDYRQLYDTISNINTFPIFFNKYFNSNIPLQKDKVVFTPY